MALSRMASMRLLGSASKSVLIPKHKVEMSAALIRLISSSEKKTSSAVANRSFGRSEEMPPNEIANPPRTPEDFIDAVKKPRNWISYGYSYYDKERDADVYHATMFFLVSLMVVVGSAWIAYLPDWRQQDWALREAYLELARREKYGLPLVDKDLVPVDRINLPSEEFLYEEGHEVYL
ncbi:NADH dehydrogenase [ubiquinone] 1 beta subcomplex subunit 11, mitochondrial [Galendromus occidentalis]|uniref:NADH dehydrogenase [ubiquinone] 1 beta subcomplex subunit 11, mitochondrial n=1 Tax=Galendromus occidentalis TaxID=34638 RepID=A0AAJ6QP23_9ACAR|nr:NADH dehydrogenase [ubiquinone] 1 beta subcomplex subunit 11, mitochondrial [Galendromus occidentalis]